MTRFSHYDAIFISPHLDDTVWSAGGALIKSSSRGNVLVLNVFTDYGKQTFTRKKEEEKVSHSSGYESLFLDFPDLPQRDFFGFFPHRRHRLLSKKDEKMVTQISDTLQKILKNIEYDRLYFPLGVGKHIDHQICFQVGMSGFYSDKLFFYEDIPYAMKSGSIEKRIRYLEKKWKKFKTEPCFLEIDLLFDEKIRAVLTYQSQWKAFFSSKEKLTENFQNFHSHLQKDKILLQERFWKFVS